MEPKPNLTPCPFCGLGFEFQDSYQRYVHKCPVLEELRVDNFYLYPSDIKIWNTRAPTDFEIKARRLLEELAFRGPSTEDIVKMAITRFNTKYEPLANFMMGEDAEKANIALKVRKFLGENP
jgi:hypothetical protein